MPNAAITLKQGFNLLNQAEVCMMGGVVQGAHFERA